MEKSLEVLAYDAHMMTWLELSSFREGMGKTDPAIDQELWLS